MATSFLRAGQRHRRCARSLPSSLVSEADVTSRPACLLDQGSDGVSHVSDVSSITELERFARE